MSGPYTLKKSYINHLGLDLKSTDLVRPDGYASGMLNAQYAKSGDIEKRKGYHCYAPKVDSTGDSVGGLGLYVFNRNYPLDISPAGIVAGQRDTQVLSCGRFLHKLQEAYIKIVYTGSDQAIFQSVYFDSSSGTYKFRIYSATTDSNVALVDLGTGFEVSPMTISGLVTALALGVDYTVTTSNPTLGYAAFLKPVRDANLSDLGAAGYTTKTGWWKKVESSYTNPFDGSWSRRGSEVIENVSAVEMNNAMYFSNGYDPMLKHDGTYLYKAGVPEPASFALSLGSIGPSTYIVGKYYSFKYNYRNTDNSLIDTEGNVLTRTFQYNPAVFTTVTAAGASVTSITVGSVAGLSPGHRLQFTASGVVIIGIIDTIVGLVVNFVTSQIYNAESGDTVANFTVAGGESVYKQFAIDATVPNLQSDYNVRYNTTNAVGTGTTVLPVATGGDRFSLGDVVYFYDSDNLALVRAVVSASTATTISITNIVDLYTGASYASVGFPSGNIITGGLFHVFWRTSGAASAAAAEALLYYNSLTQPNIPTVASSTIPLVDQFASETQSGELFVEPAADRGLPPKMKYLSVHRGQLVGNGDPTSLKAVHFSDIDSPEHFPAGRSSINVETYVGDEMSGVAPNNNVLCVFKERSIHTISGDLTTLAVRVDPLVNDIGCVSHHTIRDVRGALYFQSDRGPYKMLGGQLPVPVADARTEPVYSQDILVDEQRFRLKRCYAFNDRTQEKYVLFVPAETAAGSWKVNNTNSRVFAFDYYRQDAALEWSNFDISSGAVEAGDDVFFQGRVPNSNSALVDTYLFRRLNLDDAWDYQDNLIPIAWEYDANWEALGDPSVYKRFLKLRLFSINDLPNNDLRLSIKSETNYIKDATKADISFSFPNTGYGVSGYGSSAYGSQREQAIYKRLNSERVRSMRIRFSNNNPQENVSITGWELEISTTYKMEFKR